MTAWRPPDSPVEEYFSQTSCHRKPRDVDGFIEGYNAFLNDRRNCSISFSHEGRSWGWKYGYHLALTQYGMTPAEWVEQNRQRDRERRGMREHAKMIREMGMVGGLRNG